MRKESMASEGGRVSVPCEYRALKECLDRNQGRRERCQRECQEFQTACDNNKRCVCSISCGVSIDQSCRLAAEGKLTPPTK